MPSTPIHDIELSYVDRGNGDPVVLVHGFPLDHRMWDAQIAAVARRYRAIAPDLPGFGRSGSRSNEAFTMEQFADDLAALLDARQVHTPVVMCGLSMGGYIALEFWKRHRSRLRGLVLCDTRADADSAAGAALRCQTADRVLREGPAVLIETMLPRLLTAATVAGRPEVVESLRGMMAGGDARGVAAASRGMAQRRDFTPLLAAIDCPTLVLVGGEDVISTPAEMAAIARDIPGARLVEIAGAGHLSPLEQPVAVSAALMQFLDGLPQ
jgi:pimeloyl-ACP methyl ester carboxylesterase